MFKMAVISDIHGNYYALKAALEDIAQRNVDCICCLGDSIAIGHQGNEVIEALRGVNNLHIISGNHEYAVIAARLELSAPKGHENERLHHEWVAKDLTEANFNYINNLSRDAIIEHESLTFKLVHYPYDNELNYISFNEGLPEYLSYDEDYVLHGHDHLGNDNELKDKKGTCFLNPTALGCSHDDKVRFSILTIDKGVVAEERCAIVYERKLFLDSIKDTDIPHKAEILKIFFGE